MKARAVDLVGTWGKNVRHERRQLRVGFTDRVNIKRPGELRYVIDVEYEDTGRAVFEFAKKSEAEQCFAALTGVAWPW